MRRSEGRILDDKEWQALVSCWLVLTTTRETRPARKGVCKETRGNAVDAYVKTQAYERAAQVSHTRTVRSTDCDGPALRRHNPEPATQRSLRLVWRSHSEAHFLHAGGLMAIALSRAPMRSMYSEKAAYSPAALAIGLCTPVRNLKMKF